MVTDTNTTGSSTTGSRMPSGASAQAGENVTSEALSKSASKLASQAQDKVSGLLQGQMEAGADYVHMVSQTAHSFADDLESKAPVLARYMHSAAERADLFAEDIRHRSPDEMFNMASDYARRNPRVFFGGAIALGFVLSRFLESGSEREASYASERVSDEAAQMGRRDFNQGSEEARSSMRSRQGLSRDVLAREDTRNAR